MTVVVQVQGGADDGVNWSSSNPGVASVSQEGVVSGHQIGSVGITATSKFDSRVKDLATVEVTAVSNEPASISIQSVTQSGTPFPVNPLAVKGQIDVTMHVSPGDQTVAKIELLVNQTVVAFQIFNGPVASPAVFPPALAAAPFLVTLSFNTAAYDPATAAPLFPNTGHALTARVSTVANPPVTATVPLTFANDNAFFAEVTTSGPSAADGSGRQWASGNLTVRARAVIYSAGITLSSAVVSHPGLQSRTSGADGLVIWPANVSIAAGGSQNYSNNGTTDALTPIVLGSTLSNGLEGPSGAFLNAADVRLRLDNRPPSPGVLALTNQSETSACCSGSWVGATYSFASGHSPAPSDGEGVDGSGIGPGGVTYHVGPGSSTTEQLAQSPAVTNPATLQESLFSNEYSVVARIRDRVGNVTLARLTASSSNPTTTFGVDKQAPTLTFDETFSVAAGAVNPPVVIFATQATDAGNSGFIATPIAHRLYSNFSTSQCFVGGAGCSPVLGGFLFSPPAFTAAGYYTYEAVMRDQAGNQSPAVMRTVLFDMTAPAIVAQAIPAPLTPGSLTTFSASLTDNVDIRSAQHRFDFQGFVGAASSIPFSPVNVLSPFGSPIVPATTVFQGVLLVRSLEQTSVAGAPTGGLAPTEATRFRVVDHAGLVTSTAQPFPGGALSQGTGAADRMLQTFRITAPASASALCSGGSCGLTPQVVAITAEAAGPGGSFAPPFQRVFFYWVDAQGVIQLIGSTNAPEGNESGGTRRWTWTLNFSAPGAPPQAGVTIFAIGVDSEGDALKTRDNTSISIVPGS